jgi:hypothetical protein
VAGLSRRTLHLQKHYVAIMVLRRVMKKLTVSIITTQTGKFMDNEMLAVLHLRGVTLIYKYPVYVSQLNRAVK